MEEVTSNETIAVIMDYLLCHEVKYAGKKDTIFGPSVLLADWRAAVILKGFVVS